MEDLYSTEKIGGIQLLAPEAWDARIVKIIPYNRYLDLSLLAHPERL